MHNDVANHGVEFTYLRDVVAIAGLRDVGILGKLIVSASESPGRYIAITIGCQA